MEEGHIAPSEEEVGEEEPEVKVPPVTLVTDEYGWLPMVARVIR